MQIEFGENITENTKSLMNRIPNLFQEIQIQEYNLFTDCTIRITNENRFQCEIAFNSHILISEVTIYIIWSLCMAHHNFYIDFCKGKEPNGEYMQICSEKWNDIKPQLDWAVNFLTDTDKPAIERNFNLHFNESNEVTKIFNYSLMFFLAHELFHTIHSNSNYSPIIEEKQCDFSATKCIINGLSNIDYLERAKGVVLGLMVLNVYGIHSSNYDGVTHPFTYDRLINNIELVFGKENDKIWGLTMAVFALHCTQKGLGKPEGVFDNFYDAMIGYKTLIENS